MLPARFKRYAFAVDTFGLYRRYPHHRWRQQCIVIADSFAPTLVCPSALAAILCVCHPYSDRARRAASRIFARITVVSAQQHDSRLMLYRRVNTLHRSFKFDTLSNIRVKHPRPCACGATLAVRPPPPPMSSSFSNMVHTCNHVQQH